MTKSNKSQQSFRITAAALAAFSNSVLSLLYPVNCGICGEGVDVIGNGQLCDGCWDKAILFDRPAVLCVKCGLFLKFGKSPGVFCGQCSDHDYDRAFAAGIYEGALARSVLDLKVVPNVPFRIKKILTDFLKGSEAANADIIIPVPLSLKSKLERGFNQAELLADIAGEITGVVVDKISLKRKHHSVKHRAAMDRKARELSVRNAFEVKRPKIIRGKNILLIDDLMTSGATASNCAKTLKKAGAAKVYVFTLARTGSNKVN